MTITLQDFTPRKVLLLFLLLSFVFSSLGLLVSTHNTHSHEVLTHSHSHNHHHHPFGRRGILQAQEEDDDEQQQEKPKPIKKKPTTPPTSSTTTTSSLSTKNKTKLIKPSANNSTKLVKSTSDSTKLVKPTSDSTKNQTKLLKLPSSNSTKNKTKLTKPTTDDSIKETPIIKIKLNSTSKPTKPTSILLTKKTSDLTKNKPTKPITTKSAQTKSQLTSPDKKPNKKPSQPSWLNQEDDDDIVSAIRDLPSRFQETLLPDLDIISTTSKVYLNKANKEITKGFKPIVGKTYAPIIASIVSCAFILIPLILVSLIFNRIKAYFSLQKLLIFIQIYLSIYFSILSLSSIVTGLEPLKFFYATSQSTYVCIQLLQTLAYVLYLLMLLMYMVLVFSTDTGMTSKILGLAQTFVGFAVGLHYYMTVFHRAVLHQPPKTSWKVHAIYATCFLLICLLARAERRKKAYLAEGGEEGKTS